MADFFKALAEHAFLQNALLAGLLASVSCGVMGTYVVVRRISFLAGGIAHSVLGGMGIAYFLGKSPLLGALLAAIIAALIIGLVNLRWHEQEDTIIAALWAIGMAIGIIFITRTPGYNTDLMSYLFGNILLVRQEQLYLLAALDVLILTLVVLFYKQLQAVVFDQEFAALRGMHVEWFYLLLLCLVALTVVILVQIVGLIMVIALLTLPAAIARQYASSLGKMMLIAMVLAMIFNSSGVAVSFELDLPAGATVILIAGLLYFGSLVATAVVRRWRAQKLIR
ncbi:MAG: metal ABC transporter permease [Gammaproteobacteria bacterium]|nr:metal ABC transporter permease [Gammaproteobacteria bacterium]